MQINITGAARRLIIAIVLGATLVPLAPNTGAVSAKQQLTSSERVEIAHHIAGDLR